MLDQVPEVEGAMVVLDVKTGEILALAGGYDFQRSKFNRAVQSLRQTGSSFKPFVYADCDRARVQCRRHGVRLAGEHRSSTR